MGVEPGTMAVKAALMAAQMALTMSQKIEGPRLDSLDVTTADYGTPIPRFWGTRRLDGCPIIWAEKLREKKVESKTKGGKYSEYKYYGTFAILIADHAINRVSRIWMDKHLVYDVTKAGPISVATSILQGLTGPVKLTAGRNMRIYTGSQTEPDSRMEAWCEDRYGADSCPAYKDISYIVFRELPLEKFGNRLPQVTVEAVNNASTNYLSAESPETSPLSGDFRFSPGYERFYADGSIWDTATRTRISNIDYTPSALGSSGDAWNVNGGVIEYYVNDGAQFSAEFDIDMTANGVSVFPTPFGDAVWLRPLAGFSSAIQRVGDQEATQPGFTVTSFAQDSAGNIWAGGTDWGTSQVYLLCIEGSRTGDGFDFTALSSERIALYINSNDDFVFRQDGDLYRYDSAFNPIDTGSITGSGTLSHVDGNDSLWHTSTTAVTEYDLISLTSVRTESGGLWVGASSIHEGVYEPVTHAILSKSDGQITWRFLDRVGSDGTLLADVVSDVAEWCGVEEVDVSDLDQTVQGYSVVQGSGKDMLSPLLDIHDVDAHPHDFGVKFSTRGNAAAGTIPVSEFVREGDEARYQVTIKQDTDLPRQISISFADQDKEQQTNTVLAQRPLDAMDGERTQQIDLTTYVGTPGDMQKFADRYHRRQWNGREGVANALTAQYLSLEPGDVWNLQLDSVTQSHRLKKLTLSQGRLNAEWERDFASLHTLGTGGGAELDARDDDEILVPGPTRGIVRDTPLLEDGHADDVPLLYYGAGKYPGATFWPGANLYEGDPDGNDFSPWKGIGPSDGVTWGYATNELATANPNLWDRGNSLNVTCNSTLTSTTEAAIDADPTLNLAFVGNELLNFTTATLEANGTYTLSGFKRGRRGTEWAVDDHTVGDEFVLVDNLATDGLGLSDVGLTLFYKAQSVGRDLSGTAVIELSPFTGATLKPYAPARLKWYFDGTDLLGTIIRRTRIGGAWVGGTTIPLSENSEEYEVEIYNGATLKRTITVTGTNTFTYTAAMAAADSITLPTPPTAHVYQMSDAVGRGFALAA